jgi:hypothetical protein
MHNNEEHTRGGPDDNNRYTQFQKTNFAKTLVEVGEDKSYFERNKWVIKLKETSQVYGYFLTPVFSLWLHSV